MLVSGGGGLYSGAYIRGSLYSGRDSGIYGISLPLILTFFRSEQIIFSSK